MKMICFVLLLLSVVSVQAETELFYTPQLSCVGTFPEGESFDRLRKNGYGTLAFLATSFWSTRSDCTLAPSLQVDLGYPDSPSFDLMDRAVMRSITGGESWYMRPLLIDREKNQVMVQDIVFYTDQSLVLSITEVDEQTGVMHLEGIYDKWGTSERDIEEFGYRMSCTAVLVPEGAGREEVLQTLQLTTNSCGDNPQFILD